jgi:hypothetical protein
MRSKLTVILDHTIELPHHIKESIQNALDQRQLVQLLDPLIQQLYVDLQQSQDFRELVSTASNFTPSDASPVFHHALEENDRYRLSLIGVHHFSQIPVHDHPHTMGVQLVVHGRLQVRNYQVQETVREPSIVRLECLSETDLGVGSTAIIENGAKHLHGLLPLNLTAVFLSFQTPPLMADRQAWYFPAHPFADCGQLATWNRVLKSSEKVEAHLNQTSQPKLRDAMSW